MNIAIILSGVLLANKQIDKTQLEAITNTNVVEQYKIIPKEIIQLRVAENIQKQVVAKKKITKKKTTKKKTTKKVVKKATKKTTKKSKKKSVKVKKTTKKVYMNAKGSKAEIQNYAYSLVKSYGWSDYDWECLVKLWNRESSWNPNAVNKSSGACGIPQSLPCSKMKSFGSDYRTNYKTQVKWGLNYIKNRYGTPSEAWGHSQRTGWY